MGKAARWFRRLFCLRNRSAHYKDSVHQAHISKDQAAQVKTQAGAHVSEEEERAVTQVKVKVAARAHVKVVGGAHVSGKWAHVREEERAAVKIQAHFRSYLARRALRALKSLVKLQALVRGHIMRKQTLHRMHSLLRVQARARAGRAQISDSPISSAKSSHFCNPGPETPEKFEHIIRSDSARRDHSPILKRNSSKSTSRMNTQDNQQNDWYWSGHIKGHSAKNCYANHGKSDKIVEIDTFKSHLMPKKKNLSSDQYSHSLSTSKDSTTHQTLASPSSYEVRSFSPIKAPQDLDESPFCTAHNSPQFYSASSRSRKSIFTPTKSDGSRSYLSGYSDHPNYMACTESSKAKTRSVSAPKQRPQMERSGSARRYLVYNYEESKINLQRGPEIYASFVNKAYPGSGRLDRLGLPVIYNSYLNGY